MLKAHFTHRFSASFILLLELNSTLEDNQNISLSGFKSMKDCNQCGKCCIKYGTGGLSASADEIEFWEVFRPEIYRYVSDKKIWLSPDTGLYFMVSFACSHQ